MKHVRFCLMIPAMSLLGVSGAALADSITPSSQTEIQDARGQSVRDRARPGYDAVGIRAGAFLILPKVDVSETYNDNIYATDTNEDSDFITAVSPQIDIKSLWSRHALNFNAGLSKYWYNDHVSENRLDWNVGADGRLDVLRDTFFTGGVDYRQAHEDRGSPNSPSAAAEPTEYNLFDASLGLNQRFNRVTARLTGTYDNYDYKDAPQVGGGTLDQDFRDRDEYLGALRVGYDVSPDTNVYVQGSLNKRSYDETTPTDRSSDGYAAVVGSEFKLSRLAEGGLYVGYQHQDYDSANFSSTSGIAYGANVNWFVTTLTTVRFSASSTIDETIDPAASGYTAQMVGIGIDHELLRNLVLSGDIGYENDDFGDNPREDDIYSALIGASYLLNQNFAVGINYGFIDRNSNLPGRDYTQNRVGITVRGQL
ncbi:outer membrane beta-barrel protein [Parvibaculum sp.]|uniref:outer membrane beta-barrel protein n=1 Tax=Parvibaculum sp. TaxID=2024848 RepID=UPI002C81FC31|nr:outer membrane beta-barrel protein [Parvibaculum sp.]HUD51414.1 outer membrane beta-barrel protein [Parvibaculum sp.]